MVDQPVIPSIFDDDFEDPANKIWFLAMHLDHRAKSIYEHTDPRVASLGWELIEIADHIQRHLDVLAPPADDTDI